MATVFSLQFLVIKATVKILLDHEDRHTLELRQKAKLVIKQLSTQCFTAVSLDILETFVDQHPRLLTGELLDVLAAPHLKTLRLNQCSRILCHQGELKYVGNVMKKCNRLQHLELNGCHPSSETTSVLCHMIGHHLNNLTSLSFEACKTLSDENVQSILLNCGNLSQLNLSLCIGITNQVFNIQQSSQSSPVDSSGGSVEGTFSKPGCASPGQHLTAVDISCNQNLTSTCIRHLVELCGSSLQVLNVSCTRMDYTLLWYLCGYSWYNAVELASSLRSQDTSDTVMSKLTREYQTLKAELNKQLAMTKESEELDADDQCVTFQLQIRSQEDDGEVGQPKEDTDVESDGENDDEEVCQSSGDKDDESQGKEDIEGVSQSNGNKDDERNVPQDRRDEDAAMNQNEDDRAVPQSRKDDEALSPSQEDAMSCPKGDGGVVLAISNVEEDMELKKEDDNSGGVHPLVIDDVELNFSEFTCTLNHSIDGVKTSPDTANYSPDKSQASDTAVDSSDNAQISPHDVNFSPDTAVDLTDNVHISPHDVNFSLDTAVDSSDNSYISPHGVASLTDALNSPQNAHASPYDVNYLQDSVKILSDCSNSSPGNDLLDEVNPSPEVISPAGSRQNSKMSLSSHHDQSLDKLVSTFVESMLEELSQPYPGENSPKFDKGDSDAGTSGHDRQMYEQEFQEDLSKQSSQAPVEKTKAIADELSSAAAACPQRSKWTRKFVPNIRDLDISNIDFDDSLGEVCFQEFLKNNKCLLRLNLSWRAITDKLLLSVQDSLAELRWLSLSECEKITSHGLACLLKVCKNLTYLNIEGMYFITDTAICSLFHQDGRCGVHSLKLSETYITDNSLNRIAKYLGSKLTVLHLNWCEEITDSGLSTITANCPCLTDFAIRQCSTSKSTLIQLADNCTGLVSLNVAAVDCLVDDIMITMATRLSSLKTLDVSWNSDLTDVAVCSLFINCPLLNDVCLDGLKPITSKPFLPIIAELVRWRRCQALIKLKLKEQKLLKKYGEPHLSSDEEYEDLFVPTRSTTYALHLRYLSLQYCDLVNDRHLAEIVAVCKGTLTIKDYYGEQIVPKLLDYSFSENMEAKMKPH